MSVVKTDDVDPVDVGGEVVYTVTVANAGPGEVPAGSVVSDAVPAGVTVTALDTGCVAAGALPLAGPTTLTCTAGLLAAGATESFVITVEADVPGIVTNSATVTVPGGVVDTNPANDTTNETTTINEPPLPVEVDVSVVKTDDVDPVDVGGEVVYTVTVANAGPGEVPAGKCGERRSSGRCDGDSARHWLCCCRCVAVGGSDDAHLHCCACWQPAQLSPS